MMSGKIESTNELETSYNWRKEDILRLIELWREKGSGKILNGDVENIFESIAMKLQARGIRIKSIGVKKKILELTEKYKSEIMQNPNKSDWEYFKEIHAVFSNIKSYRNQNESNERQIIQKEVLIGELLDSRISNIIQLQSYLKPLVHPEEFHKPHMAPVQSVILLPTENDHSKNMEESKQDTVMNVVPLISQKNLDCNKEPEISSDLEKDKLEVIKDKKYVNGRKFESLQETQINDASPLEESSRKGNIRRSIKTTKRITSIQSKILGEIVKTNRLAEIELKDSVRFAEETYNLEKKRLKITENFIERSLLIQERLCSFLSASRVKEESD